MPLDLIQKTQDNFPISRFLMEYVKYAKPFFIYADIYRCQLKGTRVTKFKTRVIGIIFSFPVSHVSPLVCWQIILALPLRYIHNPTTSHYLL